MRGSVFFLFFLCVFSNSAQNISVDSQTYTPQQLIEDILIDSNCITNVQVTNTIGGNFNGTDQSYGFFDASGTTFPFQSGIVLSTGKLTHVQGPNTPLSDDDAPNWVGDSDLEIILQENNTLNATLIEFDFTSAANQVSFRYIFASEEYQEADTNTCQYSDLFGFLIRPSSSSNYENIALVPETMTPVKVTTVHPEIPNGCQEENEIYFESFNGDISPINFNGQTKVLTATATIIPNQEYHVKLVIADEHNYRFDSAVFLEAGSFELNTDLGADRLLANQNPVCENDTVILNAFQTTATNYKWFKDNIEQIGETNTTFNVTTAGTYTVEVTLNNGCISYGEIIIEYTQTPFVSNTTLNACDDNLDGFTTYNLFNAASEITNNNTNLSISHFYTSFQDAQSNTNAISLPDTYNNTSILQIVYAYVTNQGTHCSAIAEITLDISTNTLTLPPSNACDNDNDGFTTFDLNTIRLDITSLVPNNSTITFFNTINDAFSNSNSINGDYTNVSINSEDIFVKVTTDTNQCYAITSLTLNVQETPKLLGDSTIIYCLNNFQILQTLIAGIVNDPPINYSYQWFLDGNDLVVNANFIDINTTGTYTVIATANNGCSSSRNILVTPSNTPIIETLDFTELTANNTATVTVSGEGDYEFAIDNENGSYQDNPSFNHLSHGQHTIYVRDQLGCGNTSVSFSILGFPKYFTPNGDTVNDTWKPHGIQEQFNSGLKIKIFNRYGKLITAINPTIGWNGTLSETPLPSDDYWFHIIKPNGKEYRGHFALIR